MAKQTVGTGDAVSVYRTKFNGNFDELYNGAKEVETGLTASATQTQGAGTSITQAISNFTTVATDGNAATLDTAVAGLTRVVYNNGAKNLQLFPAVSDNLGAGANASITVLPGKYVVLTAIDATNWITVNAVNAIEDFAITGAATLTRTQMFGGVGTATVTGLQTLLAGEDGMNFSIGTVGVITSVNPDGTEVFVLNGTALTAGNEIDIAAGSLATIHWDSTNSRWIVWGDSGVTDGGA